MQNGICHATSVGTSLLIRGVRSQLADAASGIAGNSAPALAGVTGEIPALEAPGLEVCPICYALLEEPERSGCANTQSCLRNPALPRHSLADKNLAATAAKWEPE